MFLFFHVLPNPLWISPTQPQMSAEERKRKYEALEKSEIRRNPDGTVELVAAAPSKSPRGGEGSGAQMSVAEAKALLERAGVKSKKHKKEKKKKDKKKKDKHKKKSKDKKSKKKKGSSSSSSDSDSDSDGGASGGGGVGSRQWKSGDFEKGSGKKKGDKDKKDKGEWGKPPGPEVEVEPITEDDYYLKNHEFAAWLKQARGTFFTDLLAEDTRRLFKEFVAEWNARRLPAKLYEGVTVAGRR